MIFLGLFKGYLEELESFSNKIAFPASFKSLDWLSYEMPLFFTENTYRRRFRK